MSRAMYGLVEIGKDLTFVAEAPQHLGGIHAPLNHLDCDLFVVLIVVTFGQVDGAHPAMTDFANHAVRAEPRPQQRGPF